MMPHAELQVDRRHPMPRHTKLWGQLLAMGEKREPHEKYIEKDVLDISLGKSMPSLTDCEKPLEFK